MTEYQEICDGKTIEELKIELAYQVNDLGFNLGDSFPSYIQDRINILKRKTMDNPKGFFICGIEVTEEHIGSKVTYVRNTARINFRDLIRG